MVRSAQHFIRTIMDKRILWSTCCEEYRDVIECTTTYPQIERVTHNSWLYATCSEERVPYAEKVVLKGAFIGAFKGAFKGFLLKRPCTQLWLVAKNLVKYIRSGIEIGLRNTCLKMGPFMTCICMSNRVSSLIKLIASIML